MADTDIRCHEPVSTLAAVLGYV